MACGEALVQKEDAAQREAAAEAAAGEGEESDGIRRCKGQAEEAGADRADPAAVEPAVLEEEGGLPAVLAEGLQAAAADNIQEKEMT